MLENKNIVKEGETFYYLANKEHFIYNHTSHKAIVLWIHFNVLGGKNMDKLRKPIYAANWKMFKTKDDALSFLYQINLKLKRC